MKLSLMLINLTLPIFLDETFKPKDNIDLEQYEAMLKMAHEAGFEAVDISNMEFDLLGAEGVKKLLEKYHLQCCSVILFENYTCLEEKEQLRVEKYTQFMIDCTATVGGKVIMLVSTRGVPGLTKQQLQQGLIENLTNAVKYASNKGVTICVEDFPNIELPMCSMDEIELLLKEVPGLRLVYDSANMLVVGEKPYEYFEHFKNDIYYYHLKDVVIETEDTLGGDLMSDGRKMFATLPGKGIIDFASLLKWIAFSDYKGYMCVEYPQLIDDKINHETNLRNIRNVLMR